MDEHPHEATVRELLPLVKKIARRMRRLIAGSDFDDLVGDGNVGLLRALETFDPSRGPTLEQYAGRIIAGAMLNGIRRLDPVSERVRREVRDAERERYALATERGELPSQAEMEARRPALRRATTHAHRYTPLSLDAPLPPDERLADDPLGDPLAWVMTRDQRAFVQNALDRLSSRHRALVEWHYFAEVSLHEIGKRLMVSPQRASQLHLAALKHLRKALHAPAAPR